MFVLVLVFGVIVGLPIAMGRYRVVCLRLLIGVRWGGIVRYAVVFVVLVR